MARRTLGPGLRYLGLGTEFAAAVGGLTLVGYWVDRHFGTRPWGLLIGAGVGLVGGMYNMIREALAGVRSEAPDAETGAGLDRPENPDGPGAGTQRR